MSVSIFLNNTKVQIVTGKKGRRGTFERSLKVDAPEGSIINGIIMEPDRFAAFLNEVWTVNNLPRKDVILVVNSNKIPGRTVTMPDMNKNKSREYMKRELADMMREGEEMILAYNLLAADKSKKMKKMYVELASREQIKDYLDIFETAGITLKAVQSAEGSIIGLLEQATAKQYKTFVMQITDENIVSNILWVDGVFNYFNSVRLFNEPGTEAYYEDCARSLSNLKQFMSANKIDSQIERIVIAGTERTDISFYGNLVANYGIEAPVEIMNYGLGTTPQQQFEAQKTIFALGGLFDSGKEENFLTNYSAKDKKNTVNPELKKNIIIVASVLAVMLIGFVTALFLRIKRENRYNELKEYNENPAIVSQAMLFDTFSEKRDRLAAQSNSIDNMLNTIDTYPVLSDDVIAVIRDTAKGYAEIEIGNFNAESGVVNVTAKAKDVEKINEYIKRLEERDIFNSVKYTGYSMNQDNTWTINVVCTFAQGVGRGDE
ncbi:MAG: hypothetical protein K5750_08715 [Eubacterium sp.]|nr:hypothetical protein [Eubacterium sp.]